MDVLGKVEFESKAMIIFRYLWDSGEQFIKLKMETGREEGQRKRNHNRRTAQTAEKRKQTRDLHPDPVIYCRHRASAELPQNSESGNQSLL